MIYFWENKKLPGIDNMYTQENDWRQAEALTVNINLS